MVSRSCARRWPRLNRAILPSDRGITGTSFSASGLRHRCPGASSPILLMFHPRLDVLPPAQRTLWPRFIDLPPHFVLYGGTAVALRCGHRTSEDFDFFSAKALKPEMLLGQVPWLRGADPRILQREDNTLTVEVAGKEGAVKLSFFGTIGFGQVQPPDRCTDNDLKIASAVDLLALKLDVIHERIEAKDYLDVCALLRAGLSLADGLSYLEALHPLATNAMIVLKTLTYFKGGDLDTLPADVKHDLEIAVSRVREVPPFTGTKTPIASEA